ncbi:MAG: dihydropteroate synthase [Acidimicrobiales bacterium]
MTATGATTLVMGVLNVTPDSFSDGGRYLDAESAVAHGLAMAAAGAAVVDVGGESTRPGAEPVEEAEELRRVLPVVQALAAYVRVSIDTTKPAVAEAAVDAGATLVNDVSASLAGVAAQAGVGWVAMHAQGPPATMQRDPRYDDVVAEVRRFLVERAEAAVAAGVGEVWIDPGIGFGKTADHNLRLLREVGALVATGWPVLVGTSRKAFLCALAGGAGADDRLEASLATAVYAMDQGAAMVRVHDVAATVHATRLIAHPTAPAGPNPLADPTAPAGPSGPPHPTAPAGPNPLADPTAPDGPAASRSTAPAGPNSLAHPTSPDGPGRGRAPASGRSRGPVVSRSTAGEQR